MAGEGGGREMNGAAVRLARGGAGATASQVSRLHPPAAGAGARGRGPPGEASSALPLPALPPPRWAAPRGERWGRCLPAFFAGVVVAEPGPPGFPFPPRPFLPVGLGTRRTERGDWPGRGPRKEKRFL